MILLHKVGLDMSEFITMPSIDDVPGEKIVDDMSKEIFVDDILTLLPFLKF